MSWIELHEELRDHPKVGRLAREFGVHKAESRGIIVGIWLWAATYQRDGDLTACAIEDIRDGCGYEGDKDFWQAILKCDLVDVEVDEEGRIVKAALHDWEKHGLKLLQSDQARQQKHRDKQRDFKERVDQAREAADRAESERESTSATSNVTVTLPSRDGHVEITPTIPNQTIPKPTSTTTGDGGVGNSKPVEEAVEAKAVASAPGNDLEQIIYDRVGWDKHKRLSRMDMDKVLKLKRSHPGVFYAALDALHGGVTKIPAFLEAVILKSVTDVKSKDLKKCRKCGHEWNPWASGQSLCPVCYPDSPAPASSQAAKITSLVGNLASQMQVKPEKPAQPKVQAVQ